MPVIRRFTTVEASEDALDAIRRLLEAAFEGDFSATDWEHALGGWHVVATEGDVVVAHAAVVRRVLDVGARALQTGYVEGVGTAPDRHGEGIGSAVMTEVAAMIRSEADLGALSTGRHSFYGRLGWERWQGPTFVRNGSETVRTEAEDDGIMVLRFGPSRGIELAAPISCEGRNGDDW